MGPALLERIDEKDYYENSRRSALHHLRCHTNPSIIKDHFESHALSVEDAEPSPLKPLPGKSTAGPGYKASVNY